jgi:hypothetical protein
MGMRCDQDEGLPPEADLFLEDQQAKQPACAECGRRFPLQTTCIGKYTGMFGCEYKLYRYHLGDGRWADDFIQEKTWSSGPVFFHGLRLSDGTVFKWPREDIDERRG